jgi:hypothetical protein
MTNDYYRCHCWETYPRECWYCADKRVGEQARRWWPLERMAARTRVAIKRERLRTGRWAEV